MQNSKSKRQKLRKKNRKKSKEIIILIIVTFPFCSLYVSYNLLIIIY